MDDIICTAKRSTVKSIFLTLCSLFLMLYFMISASAVVCCTRADDAQYHCSEFDTRVQAEEFCRVGDHLQDIVDGSCALTSCANIGCCQNLATQQCSNWVEQSQCFGTFFAFQSCETVSQCAEGCCEIGDTRIPFSAGAGPAFCEDRDGDYHESSCDSLPGVIPRGTVSGTVTDEQGNPLSGVLVRFNTHSTVTDGNGFYRISNIFQQEYTVNAFKASYSFSDLSSFDLDEDEKTKDITMSFDPTAVIRIEGRVTDSQNPNVQSQGIAGAVVSLSGSGISAVTDAFGYYHLVGQPSAGTYTLRASGQGYTSNEQSITVQSGEFYTADFTLTPSQDTGFVCGNGIIQGDQQCEVGLEHLCPNGKCNLETCMCEPTCEEAGFFCADVAYQCTNVGGNALSIYNADCQSEFNQGQGVCCDIPPTSLPECMYGETAEDASIGTTQTSGSGGPYCLCGDYLADAQGSDSNKFCCAGPSGRFISDVQCVSGVEVRGVVVDYNTGDNLEGARVQLGALFVVVTNSSSEGFNFAFPNIYAGSHTIRVTKQGYNDYSANVPVSDSDVELSPIRLRPYAAPTDFDFHVRHVKGLPQADLEITVSSVQDINRYEIFRDDGLIHTVTSSNIARSVTWTDNSLNWGETYTYNVTAYSGDDTKLFSKQRQFSPGDSACEGIMNDNQFCVSRQCFESKTKDACFDGGSVIGPVTYRALCNDKNQLRLPPGVDPHNPECEEACVVYDSGEAICAGDVDCRNLGLFPYMEYGQSSNLLGFFYRGTFTDGTCTATAAELPKFCYIDSFDLDVRTLSETSQVTTVQAVDVCLDCNRDGFCYDYNSREACEMDSCAYGSTYGTECKWHETYGEQGRGFCYSDDTTSTDYCSLCDRNRGKAFFGFDCTQDVCGNLGACYRDEHETRCLECQENTICPTFDGNPVACLGVGDNAQAVQFAGYPQLSDSSLVCGSSTVIKRSNDVCGIGTCAYDFETELCIRDSNADGIDDCIDEDDVDYDCYRDRSIPQTRFISQPIFSTSSQYNELRFQTSGDAHETWYCISDVNGYCCPGTKVENNRITYANIETHYNELVAGDGFEGERMLWFYSTSPTGNPEEIQNISITVDTKAPQYEITYEVTDTANLLDRSDITVTVTVHEDAFLCTDSLRGARSSLSYLNAESLNKDSPHESVFGNLPDGIYYYSITCQDQYGNRDESDPVAIHVNRVKRIQNPSPTNVVLRQNGARGPSDLGTGGIVFSLETVGQFRYECSYQRLNGDSSAPHSGVFGEGIQQGGNYYYETAPLSFPTSGSYSYEFGCVDNSGNTFATMEVIFTVDEIAPVSSLDLYYRRDYTRLQPSPLPSSEYYPNDIRLKISCEDPELGLPREFGCASLTYCYGTPTCNLESDGRTVTESDGVVEVISPFDVQASGVYQVKVQSRDKGGNIEGQKIFTFNIDAVGPQISLFATDRCIGEGSVIGRDGPFEFCGEWRDDFVPVRMTGEIRHEDGKRISIPSSDISITGSPPIGGFNGNFMLYDPYAGTNILTVYAEDRAGRYALASVQFYYDIYPPSILWARIMGEQPRASGGGFIIGGGSRQTQTAPAQNLQLVEVAVDDRQETHHEFGFTLIPRIRANDFNFTDRQDVFGDDVTGTVTITARADERITFTGDLYYNETENFYEHPLHQTFEFPIGWYDVLYHVEDRFGNARQYTQAFFINDTIPPFVNIEVFNEDGENVTELWYGDYTVVINPSEPLASIESLNLTFTTRAGSPAVIALTNVQEDDFQWTADLSLSPSNPALLRLQNVPAEFKIHAIDTNGLHGRSIFEGRTVRLTTMGAGEPVIVTPDMRDGERVFYTNDASYVIEGYVMKRAQQALRDGRIVLMHSSESSDPVYASQFAETRSSASDRRDAFNPREFDGARMTFIDSRTIRVVDQENEFTSGTYIEFQHAAYQKPNRELYRITSRQQAGTHDGLTYYNVGLASDLHGVSGLENGAEMQGDVLLYDTPVPDGWFDFDVTLPQSRNYFFVRSFDQLNEGIPSEVFTVIYDSEAPTVVNVTPADGTITGDRESFVSITVAPGVSGLGDFEISVNDNTIDTSRLSATENNDETVTIAYHPSQNLADGEYTMMAEIFDNAGNSVVHEWSFTIDANAPHKPQFMPSGYINEVSPLISIEFDESVELLSAKLEGPAFDSPFNLSSRLTQSQNTYTYQIPSNTVLFDGTYTIHVSARRSVLGETGEIGVFSHTFTVDTIPPVITFAREPINAERPPVNVVFSTNEPARCRYGFSQEPFDQLSHETLYTDYRSEHSFMLFHLTALQTPLFVSCVDRAGNIAHPPAGNRVIVESLQLPPPHIYTPNETLTVVLQSPGDILGSTFGADDVLDWMPSANLVLRSSKYLFTDTTTFEREHSLASADNSFVGSLRPSQPFYQNVAGNFIAIRDINGLFKEAHSSGNAYVMFTENPRSGFSLYRVSSVVDLEGQGEGMVSVAFADELPFPLSGSQTLRIFNADKPGGLFSYALPLTRGHNFFKVAAKNVAGTGLWSPVYNFVVDPTPPRFVKEFPQTGEVIGTDDFDIYVHADGVYSDIVNVVMTVDGISAPVSIEHVRDHVFKVFTPYAFGSGEHLVHVEVEDQAGHTAQKEWSFTVRTDVPSRPQIEPSGLLNNNKPSLRVEFNDDVSLVSARITGYQTRDVLSSLQTSQNRLFTGSVSSLLPDGDYYLEIGAHYEEVTQQASRGLWKEPFTIDTKPPIVDAPADITTSSIPVSFIMHTNEPAHCKYDERDVSYTNMAHSVGSSKDSGDSVNLEDSSYDVNGFHYQEEHTVTAYVANLRTTIFIRCIDEAGNAMTESALVRVNHHTTPDSVCGDGVINGNEECDGNNFGSFTSCSSYNPLFIGGSLSCYPPGSALECRIDTSNCFTEKSCETDEDCPEGDECVSGSCHPRRVCDVDEDCADDEICRSGTCVKSHCYDGIQNYDEEGVDCGGAYCPPCIECGNGQLDPGQICDGSLFGSISRCSQIPGFVGGTLRCSSSCDLDTSGCIPEEADPPEFTCGNGIIEYGQECEPGLETKTCESIGLSGGLLTCNPVTCQYDTSVCEGVEGECNDGVLNPGEDCDGDIFGVFQSCSQVPHYVGGTLRCTDECEYDFSGCIKEPVCGDGVVDPSHECDDAYGVGDLTCQSFGKEDGELRCVDCSFDTSLCGLESCVRHEDCGPGLLCLQGQCAANHCFDGIQNYDEEGVDCGGANCPPCAVCGNNIIEPGETCDGSNFGSLTGCRDIDGFVAGFLGCDMDTCQIDTSLCIPDDREYVCNNGILEPGEQCDMNVIPATCSDLGFAGGTIGCTSDCRFNTTLCEPLDDDYVDPVCGDGVLGDGQECEPSLFAPLLCSEFSDDFVSGMVDCNEDCQIVTSDCVRDDDPVCGNGIVEVGQQCDSGIGNMTCQDLGFDAGYLTCSSKTCQFDTSGCYNLPETCGDGELSPGESCDPFLPVSLVCSDFGNFKGGEVRCDENTCRYDLSGCIPADVEPGCGNGIINTELGHVCEPGIVSKTCQDLGYEEDAIPRCYPRGHEHECSFDLRSCVAPGEPICSEGDTLECAVLNQRYVKGNAQCVLDDSGERYFSTDLCWTSDDPVITIHNIDTLTEVSTPMIDVSGTVDQTTELQIYVNGALIDTLVFDSDGPSSNDFVFTNIALPRSTLTSDGMNEITLSAVGVFPTKNSTFSFLVRNVQDGPEISLAEGYSTLINRYDPDLHIVTSDVSVCFVEYIVDGVDYVLDMESDDGLLHTVVINPPFTKDSDNAVTFVCTNEIGNEARKTLLFDVVADMPLITAASVDGAQSIVEESSGYTSIVLYEELNSPFTVVVDREVQCRYTVNDADVAFEDMIPFADTSGYRMHVVTEDVLTASEFVSITAQCISRSGVLSNRYTLDVDVQVDAGLVITQITPQQVNLVEHPDIIFRTNKPAECFVTLQRVNTAARSVERKLVSRQISSGYEHSLPINQFQISTIRHNMEFGFEVLCREITNVPYRSPMSVADEFTLIADLEGPDLIIHYPEDGFVTAAYTLPVQVQTNEQARVSVFVNDILQGEKTISPGISTFNSTLKTGQNIIRITGIDGAGNINSVETIVYYTGEDVAPEIIGTFPQHGSVVNEVSELTAVVRTIYGSQIDYGKSVIRLTGEDGTVYDGAISFTPGSVSDERGELIYSIADSVPGGRLPNGNYTFELRIVDEFGFVSVHRIIEFKVDSDVPVIRLTQPVEISTDEPAIDVVYYTRESSVRLEGRIDSASPVNAIEYQVHSDGARQPTTVNFDGLHQFTATIPLDNIPEGTAREYQVRIVARNQLNKVGEYWLTIIQDRIAPDPVEIIIE